MHGITCHAEAAISSAAVELSAARVPSACCHLVGSRRVMHGITCHAEAAISSAAVELSAA